MENISPCNIAGLISNVSEEVAAQITKIAVIDNLTDTPARTNPHKCPDSSYIPGNQSLGLHFCCW